MPNAAATVRRRVTGLNAELDEEAYLGSLGGGALRLRLVSNSASISSQTRLLVSVAVSAGVGSGVSAMLQQSPPSKGVPRSAHLSHLD